MNKPKRYEGIVEIKGRKYLHLYRGTSLEWLGKDDSGYLDHNRHISFTTDKKVAEKFASINRSDGFTPIIIEAFVPIGEVDFNYSLLPRFSKMFSNGNDSGQKEYSTMWQVPLSLMKGYWNLEKGEYNENEGFEPDSVVAKTPLAALAAYQDIYNKRMPQELEELRKIYPDIENWWDKGFEKYLQLQQKINNSVQRKNINTAG